MSVLVDPNETLDKIDDVLDTLDALINDLPIANKKAYRQQVYDLYAALEQAVEDL